MKLSIRYNWAAVSAPARIKLGTHRILQLAFFSQLRAF